jgi:ketoreductase RED2
VTAGNLEGKVALVTGSSSGIGAATARLLADAGAVVVINSATSVDAGRALAAELPGASYVQGDVADEAQAQALVATTVARHGGLDILVNNAGTTAVIAHPDLAAATPDIWRRIFGVNVIGTWQVTVAAVPHLKSSGAGCIVNVSSLAGHRAVGSSIPYAASKAALSHMTVLLANVVGPEIRCERRGPPAWSTRRGRRSGDDVRAFVRAQAPLQRSGTAEDIAEVIMALVTARYVTGDVVLVDGGLHLR